MAGRVMPAVRSPFSYKAGKTALHRIPAGLKLVFVIAVSTIAFASVPGLVVSILVLLAGSALTRIRLRELFKGSKPLAVLSCLIIIVKTLQVIPAVNVSGFIEGLIISLRILATYAAAAVFFAVTTTRELRLSLTALELVVKRLFFRRRLWRRGSTAFFSMGLCLMLGFIPRFFDLWEMSSLACEARSCRRGLRRLFKLVPLVTERMMEAAADTAQALHARGFNSSL